VSGKESPFNVTANTFGGLRRKKIENFPKKRKRIATNEVKRSHQETGKRINRDKNFPTKNETSKGGKGAEL